MIKQKIVLVSLLLLFIATAVLGICNGLHDLKYSRSKWEIAVSLSVCLYGLAAIVAGAGLLQKRKWTLRITMIWAAFCAFAAGGATLIFGRAGVGSAILAGVSTLLVTAPVLMLTRWVLRRS